MEKSTPIKAVFRKWPDGSIDALFPYQPELVRGNCAGYTHIGQHFQADYNHCISKTKPATPAEYQDLLRELKSIGYDVTVIKRANRSLMSKAYSDMLLEFI